MLKKHTLKTISILLIATFVFSFVQTQNITKVSACKTNYSEYHDDWVIRNNANFYEDYEAIEEGEESKVHIIAFRGNTQKVTIPKTINDKPVETISLSAFDDTNVTDIEIPDNITHINTDSFSQKLRNINVSAQNKNFSSENGILFNKKKTAIIKYPSGKTAKSYIIPNTVRTINIYTFYGASNLETITIPKSVKNMKAVNAKYKDTIGQTFYGCSKLKSIKVDSANTSFSSRNGILYNKKRTILIKYPARKTQKTFKVPNSVKTIRTYAFDGTKNLRKLTISKNVENIQQGGWVLSFSDTYLERIDVDSKNKKYSSKNGVLYNKKKTKMLYYPTRSKRKSYKMPNSVEYVEREGFTNNKRLQTITLSNNLKVLHFENKNFPALKNIHVNRKNKKLSSKNGVLYNKKKTNLMVYPQGKTQKTFTIPKTVKLIDDTFSNNSKLQNFKVEKNSKWFSVSNGVLLDKDRTTLVKYPNGNKRKTYTTPTSVRIIKYNAFTNANNLVTINITKNVDDLEEENYFACCSVLINCMKLQNIKVSSQNTEYTDIDGVLYYKDRTTLLSYPRGRTQKSYTLPNETTRMMDFLQNHKHLKTIISTNEQAFEHFVYEKHNNKIEYQQKA